LDSERVTPYCITLGLGHVAQTASPSGHPIVEECCEEWPAVSHEG